MLRESARGEDRMARYGGDEFAVLAEGVAAADLEGYYTRLHRTLDRDRAGIAASIGWSLCGPGTAIVDCFGDADRRIYDMKRRRRMRLA